MKKMLILLLIATLVIPIATTTSAAAYDTYKTYRYVGKWDKVEFVFEYEGADRFGDVVLLSPLGNSYGQGKEGVNIEHDKITFTIKRPDAGKWTIEISAVPMDKLKISMTPDGKDFDEQHDLPVMTSEMEYNMRFIYESLDSFTQTEIDNITDKFTDITANYWGTPYIAKLSHTNIINGYGDKTFRPESATKVDEFLKMLIKAMGYDINPQTWGYWATPYIKKAIELKLTYDGEFKDYTLPIKREQAAKLMVKATGLKEFLPCDKIMNSIGSQDITDYNDISDNYKYDIATSYALGLITGIDGSFKPQDTLTRAQTSTVIMRFIDSSLRVPYTPVTLKSAKSITSKDLYGNMQTAYGYYDEVIDAAYVLKEAHHLSKGASLFSYGGFNSGFGSAFFPTLEDKAYHYGYTDPYHPEKLANEDLSIDINNNNYDKYLYEISSFRGANEIQSIKEKYIDVLKEMFKFWFEDDYAEAMDYLNKTFDNIENNLTGKYKVTLNSRYVEFRYDSSLFVYIKAKQ